MRRFLGTLRSNAIHQRISMEHRTPAGKKNRYTFALITGLLAAILFVAIIVKFLSQARVANDDMIAQQIQQLQEIFKKINDTAGIIGFRHKKQYVDFLTVKSFEGSEVGPMNLERPQKWQGPYLQENLTANGKEYQIIGTKKGFFIVPGDGVKLANGKVVGKTITIDFNTDIEALTRDPKALLSGDKALAAHITTYQNPLEALAKTDLLGENVEGEY